MKIRRTLAALIISQCITSGCVMKTFDSKEYIPACKGYSSNTKKFVKIEPFELKGTEKCQGPGCAAAAIAALAYMSGSFIVVPTYVLAHRASHAFEPDRCETIPPSDS